MFLSKKSEQLKRPNVSTAAGFTIIYKTYLRYVYSICYRYLQDPIESEDITSKIFSSIWERRHTLDQKSLQPEGAWKAYLAKAVKLKIYDYLRDQKRAEQHTAEAVRELQAFDDITDHAISHNELEKRITILVKELPPRCQEVFRMSREKGLTNKEIAAAFSISSHAVKKHIAKALNFLRERLKDYQIPKRAAG